MRRNFRNFQCLNIKCSKLFSEFVEAIDGTVKQHGREIHFSQISCPFCRSKQHKMLIPEVHNNVSHGLSRIKNTDRNLRQAAETYGVSDFRNTNGAAAMSLQPPAVPTGGEAMYSPAPGFSVPFTGSPNAAWSAGPPMAKVTAQTGKTAQSGGVSQKVLGNR